MPGEDTYRAPRDASSRRVPDEAVELALVVDDPDAPAGTFVHLPDGLHHYRFRVYALDRALELPDGAGAEELDEALDRRVVAEAPLVGTYPR